MELEKSCVTFAFVDACYFRKLLFSPPLVERSVWAGCQQARLCTSTSKSEPNRGCFFVAAQHFGIAFSLFLKFVWFQATFICFFWKFPYLPSPPSSYYVVVLGCVRLLLGFGVTMNIPGPSPLGSLPFRPCKYHQESVFTFYEMEYLACFGTLMHDSFFSFLSGRLLGLSSAFPEIITKRL